MPKNDALEQFVGKCAEATVGYAHASFFAGIHAMDAGLEAWSRACDEALEQPGKAPKSWFRAPSKAGLPQPYENPFFTWAEMWMPQATSGQFSQFAMTPWWLSAPGYSDLWTNVLRAMPASATVWPMTWSMMSMGVPQNVAKPTAEANAAAYDAMDSAQQVAKETIEQIATYTKDLETPKTGDAPTTSSADPTDPLALFRPGLPLAQSA